MMETINLLMTQTISDHSVFEFELRPYGWIVVKACVRKECLHEPIIWN